MIADANVAASLAEAAKEAYRIMDDSAALVRSRCDEAEAQQYVHAVGNVCCEIIFRIMEPLYEAHPELKPEGWD